MLPRCHINAPNNQKITRTRATVYNKDLIVCSFYCSRIIIVPMPLITYHPPPTSYHLNKTWHSSQ